MRCFQKKTFTEYGKAQGQVRVNYMKWLCGETKQKVLGIYTCRHCLEFHTTHTQNNMLNIERWHCLDTVLRVKFPRTKELGQKSL